MSEHPESRPPRQVDDPVESQHLEVEPYREEDRVEAPEWYDDTINVGEVANAEADQR